MKRALDIAIAGTALLLFSPLMLFIGAMIKITSRGPVLYRWHVIGKDGIPFIGYKFRTMVLNADALKGRLRQYNEMNGPVFKLKNDPRVTCIGKFLRRFSLDEIPQAWSVLKGEMSVVGPRPVLSEEWVHFEEWQRRKVSVTPGMISLWHVMGKPKDFQEWIRLDLEYIDQWSLLLDLKILVKGVPYVLCGRSC